MVRSWNAQVSRQRDEVQGTSEVAMVLSSLPETMSRRERIQVSHPIRGPPKTDARRWGECWPAHRRFLRTVPARFCPVAFTEVRPPRSSLSPASLILYRFGTKRVKANTVYQEFIQDKHHQHMNSTRWVTLTEFVKHLGRTGIARVDETEKGWFLAWIDNTPKALEKQVRNHASGIHS
jgi:hypothetical protein